MVFVTREQKHKGLSEQTANYRGQKKKAAANVSRE